MAWLILAGIIILPAILSADSRSDSASAPQLADHVAESVAITAVPSEQPPYPISPERQELLVSYARLNNVWRFVSFFIGLATLGIILLSGLAIRFRDWAARLKTKLLVLWGFFALVMAADFLLGFPAQVYRGFIVESQYGFMNQTFLQWLGEELLGLLILIVIGIIPVGFFYWLVNRVRKWWLLLSIGALPFFAFVIIIAPVFIAPLFNDFIPLEDKSLERDVLTLAESAGIKGSDIYQVNGSKQSTKVSAYVTGLFGTKRIILYDTLIKNFTRDEIMFVMGHEMGHYVMNHIWQGLGMAVLFTFFVLWLTDRTIHRVIGRFKQRFGFDRLGDIASLPLVLISLSIISFVAQPITNGFSRHLEEQADRYGMEITGIDGETAAIAFDKLSVLNLSDPDPHPLIEFWFYTHPSLNKRIAFVREYRR